ncbi:MULTISPECIES: hypothetical protein [unclassified Marinobacter]|uniref:hypothetical protein n=1 Tax=unclassified Marinobacter TaxID=83889 RepID=UPI00192797B4|nr:MULTISPECIES: hypothetical protein [unclassified Marinobacter]MBL3824054.1 hypothetical protein [Marinobacter sp. MC3]MBL3892854.1 hypothetical protein [Marinobacter sp. MW3]
MNRNARNGMSVPFAFALAALLGSGAASASEKLSADEISQAVSDHSYQGSMLEPNSGFNEYYAADGTIHGVDYKGEWTTKEGEMCFAYGQEPTCYSVSINGPSMVLRQDGVIKGNGMLIPGNTVK